MAIKSEIPLHEKDIIPMDGEALVVDLPSFIPSFNTAAVSLQYFLETGKAPLKQLPDILTDNFNFLGRYSSNFQKINWDKKDVVVEGINTATEKVFTAIKELGPLKELFAKKEWDKQDRVTWEREVSKIVSEKVADIPGMGKYRTVGADPSCVSDIETIVSDIETMHDLAKDVENNTATLEFDCDWMALVEGSILQRVEKEFLPDKDEPGSETGDYKVASNYYIVPNRVLNSDEDDPSKAAGHAVLVSDATGNFIEATAADKKHPYQESAIEGYTRKDAINGRLFISKSGIAYDPTMKFDQDKVDFIMFARKRIALDSKPQDLEQAWKTHTEAKSLLETRFETYKDDPAQFVESVINDPEGLPGQYVNVSTVIKQAAKIPELSEFVQNIKEGLTKLVESEALQAENLKTTSYMDIVEVTGGIVKNVYDSHTIGELWTGLKEIYKAVPAESEDVDSFGDDGCAVGSGKGILARIEDGLLYVYLYGTPVAEKMAEGINNISTAVSSVGETNIDLDPEKKERADQLRQEGFQIMEDAFENLRDIGKSLESMPFLPDDLKQNPVAQKFLEILETDNPNINGKDIETELARGIDNIVR